MIISNYIEKCISITVTITNLPKLDKNYWISIFSSKFTVDDPNLVAGIRIHITKSSFVYFYYKNITFIIFSESGSLILSICNMIEDIINDNMRIYLKNKLIITKILNDRINNHNITNTIIDKLSKYRVSIQKINKFITFQINDFIQKNFIMKYKNRLSINNLHNILYIFDPIYNIKYNIYTNGTVKLYIDVLDHNINVPQIFNNI